MSSTSKLPLTFLPWLLRWFQWLTLFTLKQSLAARRWQKSTKGQTKMKTTMCSFVSARASLLVEKEKKQISGTRVTNVQICICGVFYGIKRQVLLVQCKELQGSLRFWIPRGFQIFCQSNLFSWLNSLCDSGFQSPGIRIPQANISQIPDFTTFASDHIVKMKNYYLCCSWRHHTLGFR